MGQICMIDLKIGSYLTEDLQPPAIPVSLHTSLYPTYQRLKLWIDRFFFSHYESILNDLLLVQLLAKKRYLDHRPPSHLFRLVLSIYYMQRKLMNSATFNSHMRHIATRWIPTNLQFPFASKPVLGCLVGFNVMDRCELFDEENVIVALQKYFPELQLVKESYYRHASQYEGVKIFYFEVEKKNGTSFSLAEQKILRTNLEEKIKNSIQQLSPSVFMNLNVEDVYKNLLILSQEIHSIHDLPQVHITLDQHTGKEIVFNVSLVQVSPLHEFSIKERLFGCHLISERMVPVRNLEDRPIDAYVLRLSLPRHLSLLRGDGSLDFYAARQKVAALLTAAVGEFRDYNGGLLIKQQEHLFSFKKNLMEQNYELDLVEAFFYALVPIEKQALLDPVALSKLFIYFSEERCEKVVDHFSIKTHCSDDQTYLIIHSSNSSISPVISTVLERFTKMRDWAYNFIETNEGFFFNCILLQQNSQQVKPFIQALQESLECWREKRKSQQVLRIALEESLFSLDPRIGGEGITNNVTRVLFEGLTRFNREGHIENGVAESIEVSPDLKEYTFKLRACLWNNGSLVTAHDFAYAWKKVLSPDFKTNFANQFYLIKNAKEMKEGKAPSDAVGIHVVDDQTLRVELTHPAPYFLQLIAYPLFSPVHRFIDQECPQWPYQAEKNYPCNGPFQLKINQPAQGYQLVKNPVYWDAAHIALDQIILTKKDPFQAAQALQKEEIDWLEYRTKDKGT
ncbi:MAG: ABC transporter substrate-binding protein [Chlamydiales bacterium]